MQSIMFLKPPGGGPVDRLINLDLLASASDISSVEGREGETGTILIMQGATITMGMPFPEFLKQVEYLIAENYRISNETSAAWHNKRMADTGEMMKSVMEDIHK